MSPRDIVKLFLVFVNGIAAFVAAYPGPDLPPSVRLFAAALVSGCGAALLIVNPPGRRAREE